MQRKKIKEEAIKRYTKTDKRPTDIEEGFIYDCDINYGEFIDKIKEIFPNSCSMIRYCGVGDGNFIALDGIIGIPLNIELKSKELVTWHTSLCVDRYHNDNSPTIDRFKHIIKKYYTFDDMLNDIAFIKECMELYKYQFRVKEKKKNGKIKDKSGRSK